MYCQFTLKMHGNKVIQFFYKWGKQDIVTTTQYAVFCGLFVITVNGDYLRDQKQGKIASVCLKFYQISLNRLYNTTKNNPTFL